MGKNIGSANIVRAEPVASSRVRLLCDDRLLVCRPNQALGVQLDRIDLRIFAVLFLCAGFGELHPLVFVEMLERNTLPHTWGLVK